MWDFNTFINDHKLKSFNQYKDLNYINTYIFIDDLMCIRGGAIYCLDEPAGRDG